MILVGNVPNKVITINEEQYKLLLKEGIEYTKNNDNSINAYINSKTDDASNQYADTRVFGTKKDILFGDGTSNTQSLSDVYNANQAVINAYEAVKEYVERGRQGKLVLPDNIPFQTKSAILKKVEDETISDENLLLWVKQALLRSHFKGDDSIRKYNQVSMSTSNKVARYTTGIIPRTDFKYIALFNITDFNFTDVLKNGYMRQNPNTDSLLGISSQDRKRDTNGNLASLDLTYDGESLPMLPNGKADIANNFSLSGVKPYHYKQTDKVNGETYNSINQFLDKSIMYASYALKQEGFKPDMIISVPSSSDFNKHYCTNLSHKLGIPYEQNIFERNVVNVRLGNGNDPMELAKDGVHPGQISRFVNGVKSIALKEISYFIGLPINKFLMRYRNELENISKYKYSREYYHFDEIKKNLVPFLYDLVEKRDNLSEFLMDFDIGHLKKLYDYTDDERVEMYRQAAKYNGIRWSNSWINQDGTVNIKAMEDKIGPNNIQLIKQYVNQFTRNRNIKRKTRIEEVIKEFINRHYSEIQIVLQRTQDEANKYSEILQKEGYKPNFALKRFKITELPKETRNYLHGVYVIADPRFKENTNFFKKFINSNVLLVDEDINSGASLRLAAEALQMKMPKEWNHSHLLGLVNASAKTGY